MSLRAEILSQPEVAARFLERAPAVMGPLAATIRARGVDQVVIAARGTSDHAAIYAQYVLGIRHGLSVGLGTPSVISLYEAQPRLDRSLVIGISQSGASPDVVGVIAEGRRQGAPTVAIANDPGIAAGPGRGDDDRPGRRPRARDRGDQDLHDGTPGHRRPERGPAPRRQRLRGHGRRRAPGRDPGCARLGHGPGARGHRLSADQAADDRLLILARGYKYATAREWALKLKELSHVFADPYSAADLEHGPLALLERGVPVIAMVRPGPTRDGFVELLARLRADLSADLAIVSDDEDALRLARWPLRLPAGTPEWLGPVVSIVVGQLHALHLTRARGLDPEAPRHINKVTRTS